MEELYNLGISIWINCSQAWATSMKKINIGQFTSYLLLELNLQPKALY